MNFLEILDFGLMALVAMFLLFGTLALVAPVKPSARFVNFLRALPSVAFWVAFSAVSAVLNFLWLQFLFPVFAITIWCIAHVLCYLWDTAMEYLRYTAMEYLRYTAEERCFRQICRLNIAAERRAARAQVALEHEWFLQRKAAFPLSTELGTSAATAPSAVLSWYQTASLGVPPMFTGDGLPAAPPATPIVGRGNNTVMMDAGSSNTVHQSGCPPHQQHVGWPLRLLGLAPVRRDIHAIAAAAGGPLLPLRIRLHSRDELDAYVRLAFPHSSLTDDLPGVLEDEALRRFGQAAFRR